MIPELVSFVILLVVFILAYGLASQALINPAQVDFCLFVAFVVFVVSLLISLSVSLILLVVFYELANQALILSQLSPLEIQRGKRSSNETGKNILMTTEEGRGG